MKKVLLTGAYKWTEEKIDKVKALGFETSFIQDERVPLEIDASEFDAVVIPLYVCFEKLFNRNLLYTECCI